MNKAIIMGNLCADPEVREVGDTSVCKLRVAANEKWKDKTTGELKERAEFHDIDVWGKQAEHCAQYLTKGRQVLVEGSIHYRKVEVEGEPTKFFTSIKARNVQFLGGKGDTPSDTAPSEPKSEIPF